MVLTARAHRRF